MSWLYKLLDPMNMFPWTILLLSYIKKLGGDKIIYLKKEGLESISDKLNPFWRDILLNLSELLPPNDEEENNIINISSQPIWLNFIVKRNGIFLLLTHIVIMVSFLLMILSLKINSFCHIRNFKTNI
jgi:hypothetical protein